MRIEERKTEMKFKIVKASEVNPNTLVITRTDGQSVKSDTIYLNINLSKPHGKECYEVLKRHGYSIPEVEEFLNFLNPKE